MKIIWTTHLQQRARERGIDPTLVDRAIRYPDKIEKSSTPSSSKHLKVIANEQIIAAVKRDRGNWIVTSVWKRPFGRKPYQKPLLERLVYRLVLWLENTIRRGLNL